MSFETALRSRIRSQAVMAIAASVEWVNRGAYPAVVLQIIYDDRAQTMGGFQAKRSVRVQIDVLALDAPTKVALREAVLSAVSPRAESDGVRFERIRGVSITDRSEQGDTHFIHRDAIDATFWFQETEI